MYTCLWFMLSLIVKRCLWEVINAEMPKFQDESWIAKDATTTSASSVEILHWRIYVKFLRIIYTYITKYAHSLTPAWAGVIILCKVDCTIVVHFLKMLHLCYISLDLWNSRAQRNNSTQIQFNPFSQKLLEKIYFSHIM